MAAVEGVACRPGLPGGEQVASERIAASQQAPGCASPSKTSRGNPSMRSSPRAMRPAAGATTGSPTLQTRSRKSLISCGASMSWYTLSLVRLGPAAVLLVRSLTAVMVKSLRLRVGTPAGDGRSLLFSVQRPLWHGVARCPASAEPAASCRVRGEQLDVEALELGADQLVHRAIVQPKGLGGPPQCPLTPHGRLLLARWANRRAPQRGCASRISHHHLRRGLARALRLANQSRELVGHRGVKSSAIGAVPSAGCPPSEPRPA